MTDINRVTMIGNCGVQPEFKYFENGTLITKFNIAVNRYDGKTKKDVTNWFKVQTFSKLAEFLNKGIRVAVDGSLVANTWQDKDGNTRKEIYIQADRIQILTPKPKDEQKQVSSNQSTTNEETGLINADEIPFN